MIFKYNLMPIHCVQLDPIHRSFPEGITAFLYTICFINKKKTVQFVFKAPLHLIKSNSCFRKQVEMASFVGECSFNGLIVIINSLIMTVKLPVAALSYIPFLSFFFFPTNSCKIRVIKSWSSCKFCISWENWTNNTLWYNHGAETMRLFP